MAKTVYVCAKSKREANELVMKGTCCCSEYSKPGEKEEYMRAMPDGTIVRIFNRYNFEGRPFVRATGVWNAKKMRIV